MWSKRCDPNQGEENFFSSSSSYTVAMMSCTLAHAIHIIIHYKMRRRAESSNLKLWWFEKSERFLNTEYVPDSSRYSDSVKGGMVSVAQTIRYKKRLKANEFWRGFEDFPIYFPFTLIRLRSEHHLLADLHQILYKRSSGHEIQLAKVLWQSQCIWVKYKRLFWTQRAGICCFIFWASFGLSKFFWQVFCRRVHRYFMQSLVQIAQIANANANVKLLQKWAWPTSHNSTELKEHVDIRFNNVPCIMWE